MFEVCLKIYVYTANSKERILYKDVSGLFHTEKMANQFLKRELNEVLKMNSEDIDIQIKFYSVNTDWDDNWITPVALPSAE